MIPCRGGSSRFEWPLLLQCMTAASFATIAIVRLLGVASIEAVSLRAANKEQSDTHTAISIRPPNGSYVDRGFAFCTLLEGAFKA